MLQTVARDGPKGILGASGPPSGILFENGLGEQLILGGASGRFWALGAPKSVRNAFWSDLFGNHFEPKIGKETSKKGIPKLVPKNHRKICQKASNMMPKWKHKSVIVHVS